MTATKIAGAETTGPKKRRRLSIAAALVGGFGGLVALAVATELALGLSSAGRNTFSLLGDNAELVLSNVELRLRQRLETAERAAGHVAELAESGAFAAADRSGQDAALQAMLALAPDVAGLAYFGDEKSGLRIGVRPGDPSPRDPRGRPPGVTEEILAQASARAGAAVWAAPAWVPGLRTSLVGVVRAVRRDGVAAGYAGAGVSLGGLSRFLMQLYADLGVNAFVLYDRNHVLAHPTLAARGFDLAPGREGPPLPRIDEVDDLALAGLWRGEKPAGGGIGRGIEERRVTVAGESYYFLLRPVSGIGPQNWLAGVWYPEREAAREVRRLIAAAAAGVAVLLISVGVAFYLARRISRSIGRFADAADRVRSLDFAAARPIPPSRLAEIDRAAAAFNDMLAGLRWFEAYVPKSLVLRLMKSGLGDAALLSEERVTTVMFTDIRGFTEMAQSLSPVETQALLARHFSMLAACIEAEGGTVDKFIGDAVMAFWGAPDHQEDHAARALRAAAAIGRAVIADNLDAAQEGRRPVHVRIALHAGPVVVGNIGSAARVNYTIIGDTVNVASRLEKLARTQHRREDDVCILASEDVVGLAGRAADLPVMTAQEKHRLRGRAAPVGVWRVAPAPARDGAW